MSAEYCLPCTREFLMEILETDSVLSYESEFGAFQKFRLRGPGNFGVKEGNTVKCSGVVERGA